MFSAVQASLLPSTDSDLYTYNYRTHCVSISPMCVLYCIPTHVVPITCSTHTHTHSFTHTHTHSYTHTHTHSYTHTHIHIHTHTHTHIHSFTHTCTHARTHARTHAHTHTHTQTHTHTHTPLTYILIYTAQTYVCISRKT